ncbi:farnesyl pyrophosphate synthase [Penicillium malachiteum]|uniref:farnesyl pyrophosphate synthase n=1 Tax=Penicillium malachiteum TaxID=1324776 RepID=UPI002548237F|nr:farnesyl pyrophosphate synthase [Penicillium malachiteum]KAJ5714378.1 farnesyl pyrophosphate synthase [Penicillium malachiteum]
MNIVTKSIEPTRRTDFEAILPSIKFDILEYINRQNLPREVTTKFEKCLQYNLQGGKLNRGLSVPDSGSILLGRAIDDHEFKALTTLGWLTEILQAFFLVHDDIMDNSFTRRGQPCWFRQPDTGIMAVNDGVLLESSIFLILKSQFSTHPSYLRLMEVFHEASFHTQLGQLCDMITASEDRVDLDKFSMERYESIVQYKTSYYSFYLPVALSLYWLELDTPLNLQQTHQIMMRMGHYFQVQDDYLDVFGNSSLTGKIGTDISDNKCTWLVNKALLLATEEQHRLLYANYGQKNKACEARVRGVFDELFLEEIYKEFEDMVVQELQDMIAAVDEKEGLCQQLFTVFLSKICQRTI